ncbi:MAG: nucleotidyltransferase domain-containing protein [Acidobacteriota bacterium]|nr:nucleotidyltransferase domain-containing protein [Acidobacteriota bacterium]
MDSLQDLTSALAADPDVQLAVVFGSAAKGTLHRRSDLDLAVMGVPSTTRLAGLAVTLARIAGREVDLIPLETAPPLLRFEIARDGAVLIERHPHLWSDFQVRAMVDWWEWAPLARRFASAAMARLQSQAGHGPA